MQNPEISIIIPIYNCEKYLSRCLDSIINQTFTNIEIICINDGSTDSSLKILQDYKTKDPRIIIINQNNQKLGAARNRGLEIQKGNYITFIDSDDWIDNDYLEKLYNAIKTHNADCAISCVMKNRQNNTSYYFLNNKKEIFLTNIKNCTANLIVPPDWYVVWGKLYKKEMLKDLYFIENSFYEDIEYTMKLSTRINSIVKVPKTSYHYFENRESIIRSKNTKEEDKNKRNQKIQAIQRAEQFATENGIDYQPLCLYKEKHKLFKIKHYLDKKEYYFLGIKLFSKKTTLGIFERICFKRKTSKYLKTQHAEKRRLFLTTGNINLLNNITAIKQFNETDCKDTLIIWSFIASDLFKECNLEISKLYDFEKVYTCFEDESELYKLILRENLYNFDEIYISNQRVFIKICKKLFSKLPLNLTDEGAVGNIAKKGTNFKNIKNIFLTKYLNKIDYFGFDKQDALKIKYLDSSIFKENAKKISLKYPLDINFNSEDKNIIYCGCYYQLTGLEPDEFDNIQNQIIQSFIDTGYHVFFKPHPRDVRKYQFQSNVEILKTALPLECYQLDNIIATVSMFSFSSMQSYHYQNIPGFACIDYWKKLKKKNTDVLNLIQAYTPNMNILLEEENIKLNANVLKDKVKNYYLDFLNNKPLLSENIDLFNNTKNRKEL